MATPGGSTGSRGYTSNDYQRVGWQLQTNTGRPSSSDEHDIAYQGRHGSPPPNFPVSPTVDHGEHRGADSFSLHSTAPLAPRAVNPGMASMPTPSTAANPMPNDGLPLRNDYFAGAVRPPNSQSTTDSTGKTHHAGSSSWDLLGNIRKLEHSYEEFDTRNASEGYLRFAQGDVPNNKVCPCLSLSSRNARAEVA